MDTKAFFRLKTLPLYVLFSIIGIHVVYGQSPQGFPIKYYKNRDGISHETINQIVQDSMGFVWIGTEDGLTKWDGYKFTVYKGEVFNTRALPFARIFSLAPSSTGKLWIGGEKGVAWFDLKKEAFFLYQTPDSVPDISQYYIGALHEDDQGNLWAGAASEGGGLWKINTKTGETYWYGHISTDTNSIAHNYITCIFEDDLRRIWIGTPRGLALYENGHFHRFTNLINDPRSLPHRSVRAIEQAPGHKLWIGTRSGLALFNPNTGHCETFPISPNDPYQLDKANVKALSVDRNERLWIATEGDPTHRLVYWDQKKSRLQTQTALFSDISPNLPLEIVDLTLTKDGTMLIGSNAGLGVMPLFNPNIELIMLPPIAGVSSNGRSDVHTLAEDTNGTLWLAVREEGLFSLIPQKDTQLPFSVRQNINQLQITHFGRGGNAEGKFSSNQFRSFMIDRKNRFWIWHEDNNLDVIEIEDGKPGKIISQYFHDTLMPRPKIDALYEDKKGTIWVGGGEFLASIDPITFNCKRYLTDSLMGDIISPAGAVFMIKEDQQGNIWATHTIQGVFRLNPKTGKARLFTHDPNVPGTFSYPGSIAIVEDSSQQLWISSLGLNLYNPSTESFIYYGRPHGLSDDFIYSALLDQKNRIWLMVNGGLSYFDPVKKSFTNISDPAASIPGFGNSVTINQAGEIIYGASGSIYVLHPDSFGIDTFPTPVFITNFRIFNEPVPIGVAPDSTKHGLSFRQHITFSDSVLMHHHHNNFSIEFAALSLKNPSHNQFQYRLLPFQQDWIKTDADNRIASYTNLNPGKYVFEVMASNNDGVWNPEPRRLYIQISPPWYRTIWAYLVYSLLILAVASAIYQTWRERLRIRNQLEREKFEKEQLAKVDQLKSRFFSNISHEFRTPLTLILGPVTQLLDQPDKPEEEHNLLAMMHRNAHRLRDLINQVLDINQLESHLMPLNVEAGNLIQHFRYLASAFESFAYQKNLNYQYIIPEQTPPFFYDRDKLEKIVNNLLSNAFKFTPSGGSVRLTVTGSPLHNPEYSQWTIEVADTGPGIAADQLQRIFDRYYQVDDSATRRQEGSGIGLTLAKELVELMSGEIMVESEPGNGAIFTVKLSLKQAPPEAAEVPVVEKPEIAPVILSSPQKIKTAAPGAEKPIILIVEDQPDMRQFIKSGLSDYYQIITAANGREGLDIASETIPDLVISDVMMPEMDGFEFCYQLKQQETTSHIPVVMLTARVGMESKIEGHKIGADDYLIKPFEARELKAIVDNLIIQRKKLREVFAKITKVEPGKMDITPVDVQFLKRVQEYLEEKYSDSGLSAESFAEAMNMSRMQLHRKLKALLDQSASDLIRSFRLGKAKDLLEQSGFTVAEIAFQVGFEDPAYFGRLFKKHVGETPAGYAENSRR